MNQQAISKLRNYLISEEYDTISVNLDGDDGNISLYLNNKQYMKYIRDIFDESARMF